jgi:hypothetical protein
VLRRELLALGRAADEVRLFVAACVQVAFEMKMKMKMKI